jgi:ABC-2 type transport system permease protein
VTNLRWVPQVLSLELRKLLAYRGDLFVQFIGPIVSELGIAYFLWKAIFEHLGATQLGGYSFHGMMFYYLLAPLIDRVIRGSEWKSNISVDIYDGSLTRYLVYPISFFIYKFFTQVAESLIRLIQLLIGVTAFIIAFGIPVEFKIQLANVLAGSLLVVFAIGLYFLLAALIELVAFWADNVWSLMVTLRFTILLLGGSLIPLSLFPAWSRSLLALTPFPYFISFPIRTLQGDVSNLEFFTGIAVMLTWTLLFSLATRIVWQKGLRQYTGVGI